MPPSVCSWHLLLFHLLPFPHITTFSPPFYLASFSLNTCVILSPIPLLPSAPCHPPSVVPHLFYLNLTISHPPLLWSHGQILYAPLQLHLLSGGVGINLSPHHSRFLLLSACLIKLPPSPMHTQAYFSINLSLCLSPSHPLLSLSASFPQTV